MGGAALRSRRDPRSAERVGGSAPRSDATPLLLSVKQIGNTLASTDALSEYAYSLLVRLCTDLADGCGELGDEPFNRPPGSLVGDLADRGTERGDLSLDLALQIPECGSVPLDLDAPDAVTSPLSPSCRGGVERSLP